MMNNNNLKCAKYNMKPLLKLHITLFLCDRLFVGEPMRSLVCMRMGWAVSSMFSDALLVV